MIAPADESTWGKGKKKKASPGINTSAVVPGRRTFRGTENRKMKIVKCKDDEYGDAREKKTRRGGKKKKTEEKRKGEKKDQIKGNNKGGWGKVRACSTHFHERG